MSEPSREELREIRARVQKGFAWLRRRGYVCRARYKCCMTCAIAGIATLARESQKEYSCYWNWQDEEYFQATGLLYLRFCYFPPENLSDKIDTTLLEKRMGTTIVKAMTRYGLALDWDEDAGRAIIITGLRQGE
ncbi:MAG: hypothetical protein GX130_02475 [Candidatus Hydrogenedens sp.]|nr:hypothetical protein [Candidatus Hydrogenedens sp.]